ncbi:DUF4910 domain-containing protein [Gammaproteobacteria bacterium]|nr:DUF4910 domain-containing protein [Gammaproteobacteria bacterium]
MEIYDELGSKEMNHFEEVVNLPKERGAEMHSWAQDLFPICRSITGQGVRETLAYLSKQSVKINVKSIPSGTKVFDWTVPDEWKISEGWVKDSNGIKIIDFKENNLHVVGYSTGVNKKLSREELFDHLHTLPDQPNAIPYVTSYYKRQWGFCCSEEQKKEMKDSSYEVYIASEHFKGEMNYGEVIIKGESKKEILISSYICHPSMANNEISGPVVTAMIAKILSKFKLNYTLRIIFIPETIGSIAYISQHLEHLKKNTIAGFNITCVGDDRCYSFLPSRNGKTISDRAAKHVLSHISEEYKKYSWFDRGSDERQFCSPGVDLPMCLIMRSKFNAYPEYHTSLDNLSIISPSGLLGGLRANLLAILSVDANYFANSVQYCEPMLSKYGIVADTSIKKEGAGMSVGRKHKAFLSMSDGKIDLIEMSDYLSIPIWEAFTLGEELHELGLITKDN